LPAACRHDDTLVEDKIFSLFGLIRNDDAHYDDW